ncbi:Kinesin family protein [Pseudohyphozyma bogoriensis]|nr:Kinesin family protein [Pseudohyphozyma bogoriensis]
MSKRTSEQALLTPPTSPNPSLNSSPRSARGKAKAARGRRRASSVPLPDSDSDDDLEGPAQRHRITFTPISTPSFDKAVQLDGGDRTTDLVDRPARDGASASRGGALGTGAQEDLAESASGNEILPKSGSIDYKALVAEQAKKIAEHEATIAEQATTIANQDAELFTVKEAHGQKSEELLKERLQRSALNRKYRRSKPVAKDGAEMRTLGMSNETANRSIMVPFQMVLDYAATFTPPKPFRWANYLHFGKDLAKELRNLSRPRNGPRHHDNLLILEAVAFYIPLDPVVRDTFTTGGKAYNWLMSPSGTCFLTNRDARNAQYHFKGTHKARMGVSAMAPGRPRLKGLAVDPDPATGNSETVRNALAIMDGSLSL